MSGWRCFEKVFQTTIGGHQTLGLAEEARSKKEQKGAKRSKKEQEGARRSKKEQEGARRRKKEQEGARRSKKKQESTPLPAATDTATDTATTLVPRLWRWPPLMPKSNK